MPAKPPHTSRTPSARGSARGRFLLRGVLGGGLALALLVAGHALLWRWMGGQLQDGFDRWAAARRAQGWRVEHAAANRGGWPFAATLTLPRFMLEGGGATLPGGMDWRAEALVLRVALPRLDRLVVEMPGRHRLRLGPLELPFAADRLIATLPLERDVLPREASLEAERLRIGTATGAVEVRAARLGIETRITAIEGEPAVALGITAAEVRLPPPAGPLGQEVESVALDLALTGPVPPGRSPARKAEAWRDGGGTLEVRSLDLRWGAVAATATATLALDEALQPMGAGTLRLAGGAEALAAAAAAGLVAPGAAAAARMVLGLLARAPPGGGPPQLEVPLTLEDRALAVARVPLLRLPAWTWPEPARPPAPDDGDDPSLPARN